MMGAVSAPGGLAVGHAIVWACSLRFLPTVMRQRDGGDATRRRRILATSRVRRRRQRRRCPKASTPGRRVVKKEPARMLGFDRALTSWHGWRERWLICP